MTSLFVTSFDGTKIDLNVCKPAGASAETPVPIVLQGHGWTGQKSSCLNRTTFFEAGIGFASMTQRGHGSSGGEANVMDPMLEGRDIMAVIDHLASLDWVLKEDGPDGVDPVLGGLGGSYGGGFQWIGAFTDQWLRDAPTRFDALRPGNTWYDLRTALAPNDVLRTVMVGGLYAGGAVNARVAPWLHTSMATIIATGQVLDGPAPTDIGSKIHRHSAAWFVEQGMRLDIPVLVRQGAADIVFNLNEGIHAFERALTPAARARSIFVNDHAGHDAPANAPTGPVPAPAPIPVPAGPLPYTPRSEATCNTPSELAWFKHTLLGEPLQIEPALRLRTQSGSCLGLDVWPAASPRAVAGLQEPTVLPIGPRGPLRLEPLATGPLTLAGIPELSFTAVSAVPDARVFWGLAVGTSPADAKLIDQQWFPTRIGTPVAFETITSELGAIVASIPAGSHMYLAIAPAVDQFVAHSSRTPGAIVVDDVTVSLPEVA